MLIHLQTLEQLQLFVRVGMHEVLRIFAVHGDTPVLIVSAKHSLSLLRPRAKRDITVPMGRLMISAICLYDISSNSRSTTTSRNSTGIASKACLSNF